MPRFTLFAALCAAGAVAALLLIEPALAQQAQAPKRLNWFWSIFAGFVLAGMGLPSSRGSSTSRACTGFSC
jgi:hypothetical protein